MKDENRITKIPARPARLAGASAKRAGGERRKSDANGDGEI